MSDEVTGCDDDGSPLSNALAHVALRQLKQRVLKLAFRFDSHEYGDSRPDCMQKICRCADMASDIRRMLEPLPSIEEMSGSIDYGGKIDYTDL